MSRRLAALAAALVLPLLATAHAEEGGDTEAMKGALAGGYKALFTCSGLFVAGQSRPEIEANELKGVYTDYQPVLDVLPIPVIDEDARTVSVTYDRALPPRHAVYRPGMGCSLLPIGADLESAKYLPRFSEEPPVDTRETGITLGPYGKRDPISLASYSTFDAPVSFAFDKATYGEGTKTSAVLVVWKGEILAERYARGLDATTPQRTWSVAKSITVTLIGAAVKQNLLDLDNPAVVPEWNAGGDPRRAITLRDLLSMASGRDSGKSGSRTDRLYFGGASVEDTALTPVLEVPPGTRFKYANNDTLVAMKALRNALADDAAYWRFPREVLMNRIGMNSTTMETDWKGDFISSSQVWSTARDLARLGILYLNDGVWGEDRILPEGWVEYVTTPAPNQPNGKFGYGAQFWLMNNSPGVPADTYAAFGNRGQYVVIVPSKQLVIVRRGYDDAGKPGFDIARFTADIVGALDAALAARKAEEAAANAELMERALGPAGQ